MEYLQKPVEATHLCSLFPLSPQPHHPESLEHLSDWTLMFHYKTLPCPRVGCLQWSNCWGYHSPVDRRRMLVFAEGKFTYEGVKCGISGTHYHCKYAHNTYEVAFHPYNYRTTMCSGSKIAGLCSLYGLYCRYAHHSSELRVPAELYGKKDSPPKANFEDLMQLSELYGSLEAKLRQMTGLVNRRKAAIACCNCHRGERLYLYSGCGHGVCGKCAQNREITCIACGVEGILVSLDT